MIYNNSRNVETSSGINASLLSNNSFYNLVRKEDVLYLMHVTKNKELIENEGFLYPSGGCLLGTVYFTPGYKSDNGEIRLHNLGRYYYERECPNVIKKRKLSGRPTIYIFKIDCRKFRYNIEAVNYLKFGKMHYDIYNRLSYLLTNNEKKVLEETINQKLVNALPLLQKIELYKKSKKIEDKYEFIEQLRKNVKYIPIFGYVYFEALNKALMLHQSDEISRKYYERGEFFNWHYKNMMLHFYPDFFSKFNLGTFNLSYSEIKKYVIEEKIIDNIDNFELDFFEQLFILIDDALGIEQGNDIKFVENDIKKKIEEYPDKYHPLIGHLIHRELRNFKRYPDFYFYFDQVKALNIWNSWNRREILIPYNGIIPKGEIGLNPALLDNLEYEVYEAKDYRIENDFAYVKMGDKKNIKIAKKLVENKYGMMRDYMSSVNEKKLILT